MNKAFLYIIFLMSAWITSCAQMNLVPNGGFEDTVFCPIGTVIPNTSFGASNWIIPSDGTPDYFNSCSMGIVSVPQNAFGYQQAKEGEAYAGLLTHYVFPNTREYLCTELLKPLEKDKQYCWSMWVSLADYLTDYASNNIGVALSENFISSPLDGIIAVEVYGQHDGIVLDSINWTLISGTFIANGGEKYLYIGNFSDDNHTGLVQVKDDILYGSSAYYFIDDIQLKESSCIEFDFSFPNVFTPNNDGVNDYVDFQSFGGLSGIELIIYNRWGNSIFTYRGSGNSVWDGKNNSEGVYFYVLRIKDYKKAGFIHLVR